LLLVSVFLLLSLSGLYLVFRAQQEAIAERDDRISNLEAIGADIQMQIEGNPELSVDRHRTDDRGLPARAAVRATLVLENVGYEAGQLIWEVDRDKTYLPFPFEADPNGVIGFGTEQLEVGGRTRVVSDFDVPVRITARERSEFARALNSTESYQIVIRYHTRRIGGESARQTLVMRGDFESVRREMRNHLEKLGFDRDARLIDSH
jgi:hypothetical protein